jgi:hypothetical protein
MPPIEFQVYRDDVAADGTLTVMIGVDRTYNPRQLGIAPDDRELGAAQRRQQGRGADRTALL